jgi:uncharacterized protein (TIGR00730 family)
MPMVLTKTSFHAKINHMTIKKKKIRKVCVFCSSCPKVIPSLRQAAKKVGAYLAENYDEIIFGGSQSGLMESLADGVLEKGGKLTAIMTRRIKEMYGPGRGTEIIIVETIAERKAEMLKRAAAAIALPGGLETLNEISEAIALTKTNYHQKPCGILNLNGYYDLFLKFLDQAATKYRATKKRPQLFFKTSDNIADLMKKLSASK